MLTDINFVHRDWTNVKNKCRTTVNKEYSDKEPDSGFKTKLLISEHSPIRLIRVDWTWHGIKSWVATHWVRHKWECFVSTQRSDRTGIDRNKLPQDALVNFDGEANAQSLIDTWRKRLCKHAHPETTAYAEDFKRSLRPIEPELSDVLVPNCIYRCGCPEHQPCGFWKKFSEGKTTEELADIRTRYGLYAEEFYK